MKSHYQTEAEFYADVAREQAARTRQPLETKALKTKPGLRGSVVALQQRIVRLEQRVARLEVKPTKALHHSAPAPIRVTS